MEQAKMGDAQPVQLQLPPRNRTPFRTKTLLLGFLLFVMCSTILLGLVYRIGTTRYHYDLLLAKEGMQHLLQGKEHLLTLAQHSPDAHTVAEAQQEFAQALETFTRLEMDLKFVPGVMSYLPWYGQRLHTALHLVPLALALSQAGMASCDILNVLIARLHDPFDDQSHGLMATDIPIFMQNAHIIQTSLSKAVDEVDQLQLSDIQDSHVQNLIHMAHSDLPKLQKWLSGLSNIVSISPVLLGIGTPTNYLIEVLDSTELRPGGGFIGNYGTMTLSEGRLASAYITDTDLLDRPFYTSGRGIPFPPAYRWFDIARGNWGLRDSNLDADFPTNARYAESIYVREGGNVPLQGVIALTPSFIQRALVITGPITLPEYHEKVSAQNLVERIHYHQLGRGGEGPDYIASPDGYSSLRKHFIALLAKHFLARVHQVAASHAFQFLQLLADALQTKDMQLYFNNPDAEIQLHNKYLDAAIQTPPGDDLFVVDANIASNKANNAIKSTLTDNVTIDTDGNATHHATLHYAWLGSNQNYGFPLYRDYVRVYVPKESILQTLTGWQQRGHSQAFGHEVWAGFFTLANDQTHTITLIWHVPHAATHNEHGWQYHTLIQKQAGVVWMTHVQVRLPSCATLRDVSGGSKTPHRQTVILNRPLTENISLDINYICS
ncbi:DUF4012 domain-containing protein [Dictyobacter formicarum]|uniref:DUF4012 domain-containing protein n=1 Tax=Dictyobacter formicarum TaxID=2778368 RepID=A0ABQ3VBG0_9CHLR|nr:DUF4012 domain-containing protein [Dictyobacter formicarum]GHO82743.1 hypothetical protein KSZ_07490 [Dictyobacter formicarum]